MSRSCHRATFSKAACALERTTRASPLICSQVTGLRLCGMAEEPFCFSLKNSSASRTSVRCRWRISVAILSSVRRDDREGREVVRVAVALDDLRRDGRRFQSQALADFLFEFRLEVGEGADGAGKLADAHSSAAASKRVDVALRLGVPVRQFEAEGDGFGVDAVGAADHGSVLEFPGATLQHFGQRSRSSAMMAEACAMSRACAVSTTSLEVRP